MSKLIGSKAARNFILIEIFAGLKNMTIQKFLFRKYLCVLRNISLRLILCFIILSNGVFSQMETTAIINVNLDGSLGEKLASYSWSEGWTDVLFYYPEKRLQPTTQPANRVSLSERISNTPCYLLAKKNSEWLSFNKWDNNYINFDETDKLRVGIGTNNNEKLNFLNFYESEGKQYISFYKQSSNNANLAIQQIDESGKMTDQGKAYSYAPLTQPESDGNSLRIKEYQSAGSQRFDSWRDQDRHPFSCEKSWNSIKFFKIQGKTFALFYATNNPAKIYAGILPNGSTKTIHTSLNHANIKIYPVNKTDIGELTVEAQGNEFNSQTILEIFYPPTSQSKEWETPHMFMYDSTSGQGTVYKIVNDPDLRPLNVVSLAAADTVYPNIGEKIFTWKFEKGYSIVRFFKRNKKMFSLMYNPGTGISKLYEVDSTGKFVSEFNTQFNQSVLKYCKYQLERGWSDIKFFRKPFVEAQPLTVTLRSNEADDNESDYCFFIRDEKLDFDNVAPPNSSIPGHREATAMIDATSVNSHGVEERENLRDIEIWVKYSTDKNKLKDADCPTGRARIVRQIGGDLYCSFIYPSTHHPTPNILTRNEFQNGSEATGGRPSIYNYNQDVFALTYAANQSNRSVEGFVNDNKRYFITDKHEQNILPYSKVYYRWVKKIGSRIVEDEIREFIMPREFIIANLGDSFASGEGAPNEPDNPNTGDVNEAKWDDLKCHRSHKSGQMLAIQESCAQHPEIAIAWVNLGCSGAIIADVGNSAQQDDANHKIQSDSQLGLLKDWMGNRRVLDVCLIAIGVNDLNFYRIVLNLYVWGAGAGESFQTIKESSENNFSTLANSYDGLLHNFQESGITFNKIYFLGYPKGILEDKNGIRCHNPGWYGGCWGPLESLFPQEKIDFGARVLRVLNQNIEDASDVFNDHNFRSEVISTNDISHKKGICNCDGGYFNTAGMSEKTLGKREGMEGDEKKGTFHPTNKGHREIVKPVIKAALENYITKIKESARIYIPEVLECSIGFQSGGPVFVETPTPEYGDAIQISIMDLEIGRIKESVRPSKIFGNRSIK